jgi:large subunit ribosomal protein L23
MQYTDIIIRPLVTEKSTRMQQTRNEYAFEVAKAANKAEIKVAVEKLYEVKVLEVRTMTRKGKPRRTKKGETHAADWKRAIVKLDENSKIDLF